MPKPQIVPKSILGTKLGNTKGDLLENSQALINTLTLAVVTKAVEQTPSSPIGPSCVKWSPHNFQGQRGKPLTSKTSRPPILIGALLLLPLSLKLETYTLPLARDKHMGQIIKKMI